MLKHSRDFNLMRECVLGSELSPYTPAFDMQQACGTGLQAAIAAADGIAAGRYEVAAAGGVDTTSDPPIGLGDNLRRTLLKLRRSKSNVQRLKLVGTLPATLGIEIPANSEPRTGLSMGEHAAITAKEMGIKRVDQDELAVASHRNMAAAYDRGFFDDLVTPFLGLYRDDNLRPDASVEKLAKLRPVFGVKAGDATMTAGNSTPLTDGASVALLATEQWAAEHSLAPLAYFVDAETAAVDYVNGNDGLLMAPTYAVPRLLARNGLSLQDFDFYEIHEAFASVVLAHLQAWESEEYCKERLGLDAALGSIDRSKLNVNGSSLAAGHPFAATGGRILAQTAKQLAEKKAEAGSRDRSGADLDLCRRRAGRGRDSRGLTAHERIALRRDLSVGWFAHTTSGYPNVRIAPCCGLTPRPRRQRGASLDRPPVSGDGRTKRAAAGVRGSSGGLLHSAEMPQTHKIPRFRESGGLCLVRRRQPRRQPRRAP